jgi:HEAT repeat protein
VAAQDYDNLLLKLFDAEREVRRVHDELTSRATDGSGRDELVRAIRAGIGQAGSAAPEEAAVRLVCMARLLGELDGADVADALIEVLDSEHPEARNEAGEQLQGLAFDRFKEVAEAVERALVRLSPTGSHALVELPYVLVEVPEPGVVPLLSRFLKHGDPDAVAAAIEALVEVGDPAAVGALNALVDDPRTSILGEEDQESEVTIGELAAEAIELLEQIDA